MSSGAVLRQWIGLNVIERPSHLCMLCKLYRPEHFWKNILYCCSKDVKLVTYNVRWRQFVCFLWEFLTRMLDSQDVVQVVSAWFISSVSTICNLMTVEQSEGTESDTLPYDWWIWASLVFIGIFTLIASFFFKLFFWQWLMDPSRLGRLGGLFFCFFSP